MIMTENDQEVLRDWCVRCGEPIEDHATMTVDGEEHLICPVDARAVDDEHPQQQLTSFVTSGKTNGSMKS